MIRECVEIEVPAENLVLGDIIILQAGDVVPADCRILNSNQFSVDNSSITGESEPVEGELYLVYQGGVRDSREI